MSLLNIHISHFKEVHMFENEQIDFFIRAEPKFNIPEDHDVSDLLIKTNLRFEVPVFRGISKS
jgi:hypothetical protein